MTRLGERDREILVLRHLEQLSTAEMAAVLDIMSRGRLEFGVGRSITIEELGGFQVEPSDARPMLDEVLPDGRTKLILKDPSSGDFSDRIVAG